ncbi:MAG: hypothetical protein R3E42_10655 [Burkholderiaceae bacterium]
MTELNRTITVSPPSDATDASISHDAPGRDRLHSLSIICSLGVADLAVPCGVKRGTKVNTVAGPINWQDRHPNQNVCTTPAVGGQWIKDAKGRWVLEVVDNLRSPFIPKTASLNTM